MFEAGAFQRSWIDVVGIGLAGSLLAALVGLGVYGSFLGFVQSASYYDANEVVAVVAGVVGGGCALYLLMEIVGRLNSRHALVACLLSFIFSVFAVTKGMPAAVSELYGTPKTARFEVTGFDYGGKSCSRNVIAVNPEYEEFRTCVDDLDMAPQMGGVIEIRGPATSWGIVRERVIVLRRGG